MDLGKSLGHHAVARHGEQDAADGGLSRQGIEDAPRDGGCQGAQAVQELAACDGQLRGRPGARVLVLGARLHGGGRLAPGRATQRTSVPQPPRPRPLGPIPALFPSRRRRAGKHDNRLGG